MYKIIPVYFCTFWKSKADFNCANVWLYNCTNIQRNLMKIFARYPDILINICVKFYSPRTSNDFVIDVERSPLIVFDTARQTYKIIPV